MPIHAEGPHTKQTPPQIKPKQQDPTWCSLSHWRHGWSFHFLPRQFIENHHSDALVGSISPCTRMKYRNAHLWLWMFGGIERHMLVWAALFFFLGQTCEVSEVVTFVMDFFWAKAKDTDLCSTQTYFHCTVKGTNAVSATSFPCIQLGHVKGHHKQCVLLCVCVCTVVNVSLLVFTSVYVILL